MGAAYFEQTVVAKSAGEAFRQAQERARWEDGHGGYTGTIAEKPSFVMLQLPARMTAKRFLALAEEAEFNGADDEEERWERERIARLRKSGTQAQVRRAEADLRKAQRARERFWKSVPDHARLAVERAAELNADKWGPAGCIELRGAEASAARKASGKQRGIAFKFFGYASS